MNRSISLCVAVVLLLSIGVSRLHAQAQRDNLGTEFYLAWGPNEGGEGNDPTRSNMSLYITSRVIAHGKIEIPALNFFRSFVTAPGKITTVALPDGNNGSPTVEITDLEQVVHGMAVHVTSDSEVAVFGLNHKLYSSDAFMGLPLDVLGTEYRTMNYVTSNYAGQYTNPGEFWVVATNDSTNVTITLRDRSSNGTPANAPIHVRLDKGDTYLIQGDGNLSNDLTGSLIESDYPIAVFSGHMRTQIPSDAVDADGRPSRDHLVEQLPPVSAWGDSAYVVPFATSANPDLIRVLAAEDGTTVNIDGKPIGRTLNAGDFYEIRSLKGVTSIQASRPILVGQYLHTSAGSLGDPTFPAYGDPALALVFPIEQFTTTYTIVSIEDPSSFTGNFVNIVAPSSGVATMQIDGVPIPASEFSSIPGTTYMYAQHALAQGSHNLTSQKPFGVTIYALGPVDSYAYTGGTLLKTITPLKTVGLVIDFGDRVLQGPPGFAGKFDTIVTLENVSEDTVNVFDFPRRIQDVTKFSVVDPVIPPTFTIKPGEQTHFTIEFEPREINRRMHTQVTAKTDHLRAYVVDVYGRGVSDEMGLFRDPLKTLSMEPSPGDPLHGGPPATDTLDFGVFDAADPALDSGFYIGNAGTITLKVVSIDLLGPDRASFAVQKISDDQNAVLTPPFDIAQPPSAPARVIVKFTPGGANGFRYAQVEVRSFSGSLHTVYLKARIETIVPLAKPAPLAFEQTMVCETRDIPIDFTNTNDIPVHIVAADIAGADAADFAIATPIPVEIKPSETKQIKVTFLPSARGTRNATATIEFDLPKNKAPLDTKRGIRFDVPITGLGDKHVLSFAGSVHFPAFSTEEFQLPIYATSDITPFGALGYTLHISYDSTYLELVDIVTAGTIANAGYVSIFSRVLGPSSGVENGHYPDGTRSGHDTIIYTPRETTGAAGGAIAGGGPASPPLVLLRFKPHLEGLSATDRETLVKTTELTYDLDLTSPRIKATCADVSFNEPSVDLLPTCSNPYLIPEGATLGAMMMGQAYPNPTHNLATFEYGVADPPNSSSPLSLTRACPEPVEGRGAGPMSDHGGEVSAGPMSDHGGELATAASPMSEHPSETVNVTIQIVDRAGNVVRTLIDGPATPGYYHATFDGSDLPSGTYLLRMTAGQFNRTRRIVLDK